MPLNIADLQRASDVLEADKELVLIVVKNQSYNLDRVSNDLRADKEVVLRAIQGNSICL